ncbi:DNA helicase [Tanacetum coccineum]
MEQNPNNYKIGTTSHAINAGITTTTKGDNYTCLDHGPQPGPFFRYKFKGYITNTTTTVLITFFSPATDKVDDHPCTELVEKYKPADPKKIPPEILAAQGKTGVFQFHLNTLENLRDLTLDVVFDLKKQDENTGTPSSASAATTRSMEKQDETQTGKEKCHAEEEGTTPPSYSTITDATKKKGETEIAQGKSAKRALFNQQSTDPKKQKGD